MFALGRETLGPVTELELIGAFRSADIQHEVLPATRERLSTTGWLRHCSVLPIPVAHGTV